MLKQLPQYASAISKNVREIFFQELKTLAKSQIFSIALTVGYTLKHECLLNYVFPEAKRYLDDNEITACKVIAITMSMTNTYHNFSKKVNDEEIRKMPSPFSLDSLATYNINEKDFTIYCLVASIINNCEFCINAHVGKLRKKGCSSEMICDIGRVVSVIKATADVLDIERMRSYNFIVREENF